jgi:fructose-1,6-bisphosphatase/inositol monophosphatase family enzyme|eukprot:scaffold915_cov259-Chaetoceros_neogracile.AAC.10
MTICKPGLTGVAALAATSAIIYLATRKPKKKDQPSYTNIPTALLNGPHAVELKLAVQLALAAGSNMNFHLDTKGTKEGENSEAKLGINIKQNDADFATKIDILNEELIIEGIKRYFPDHEIIGEESTGTGEVDSLTDKPTWIIDPIDGTTNFASGCCLTCVSIGLCVGGRPVMGVAFSPKTQELYLAIDGLGSYRNGERIHSTDKGITKTLQNSVVCFEFGYARSEEGVNDMVNAVGRILKYGCRSTRSYGSGVLDLCYVASGRLDVVYTGIAEEGWKPWDYCAAMVIAEEAGCTIRSLKGNDFDMDGKVLNDSRFDIYSKSMICGVNETVVQECRKVVLDMQ